MCVVDSFRPRLTFTSDAHLNTNSEMISKMKDIKVTPTYNRHRPNKCATLQKHKIAIWLDETTAQRRQNKLDITTVGKRKTIILKNYSNNLSEFVINIIPPPLVQLSGIYVFQCSAALTDE